MTRKEREALEDTLAAEAHNRTLTEIQDEEDARIARRFRADMAACAETNS